MRLRSSRSPQAATLDAARSHRPIGELLDLDSAAMEQVRQRQAETHRSFGETAVELGVATDAQVRRAVEEQQAFPVLSVQDESVDPLVVNAFFPEDSLALTARNLRAVITAAVLPNGEPVRSVGFIGLDTVTELPILVANLAVACAQAGHRTLLVDAELSAPQQHRLFRLPKRSGLSMLLSNATPANVVQPTTIGGLSVVTSGPPVPNAMELLDRNRLANMIEPYCDDFDIVLVDAGAGSTALAAAFGLDAVAIILRRNFTAAQDLRSVVEQADANGQLVLGTILID
uniref:CpsD/CapB family tyrosine-protein kinase n=1 Tax=uncultured Sphingomonas sp. TaxID=158754 RepID=UPI0035CC7971